MMARHTVVHFEIPAHDTQKVSAFYQDLLGWKITPSGFGGYMMVETAPQGQGVNGGLVSKQESPQACPLNYVDVESVDEYADKAARLGGKVATPKMAVPGMGWFSVVLDPEGNPLGLWQEDAGAK